MVPGLFGPGVIGIIAGCERLSRAGEEVEIIAIKAVGRAHRVIAFRNQNDVIVVGHDCRINASIIGIDSLERVASVTLDLINVDLFEIGF